MTNALYEALEAERERNRIVGNVMNEVAYIQNQVNEGKFKPGEYRESRHFKNTFEFYCKELAKMIQDDKYRDTGTDLARNAFDLAAAFFPEMYDLLN